MKKILSVGIILLLMSVAVTQSVNASTYQNTDTTTISVEFIGCNNKKSYSLEVSFSQALKIKNMLDNQSKKFENITSEEESLNIIVNIFRDLEAEGLMEKNDRVCLIDFYQKFNNVGFSGTLPGVMQSKHNYTNLFAFLISHSDSYVNDIPFLVLFVGMFGYLSLYFAMAAHLFFLATLCLIFYGTFLSLALLLRNIPLKFWTILVSESPIEIWSVGLKGYDHSDYPFAEFIGFKGIKINIDGGSYCIGHALSILIEPINPIEK